MNSGKEFGAYGLVGKDKVHAESVEGPDFAEAKRDRWVRGHQLLDEAEKRAAEERETRHQGGVEEGGRLLHGSQQRMGRKPE